MSKKIQSDVKLSRYLTSLDLFYGNFQLKFHHKMHKQTYRVLGLKDCKNKVQGSFEGPYQNHEQFKQKS